MATNYIPIAPKPPRGTGATPPSTKSGVGLGGSASTSTDPYAAYQKRQERKEREAKKKAATRYINQAKALEAQAKALQHALSKKGFRKALNRQLNNIDRVSRQQDRILLQGYRDRVGSLEQASEDNEAAAAAQTFANLTNRGRERASAMAEIAAQGAGESDLLRAQQLSLRNWQANQNDINRSFYDTLTSVNSSLTDLTTDTRTGRANIAAQANADRAQLWNNFYDQRAETLTQLGNVRGQQAEYYGLANEQVSRKKTNKARKQAEKASGKAFMQAAKVASRAYKDPGVKNLLRWEGAADFEGRINNSQFIDSATEIDTGRPEGATLRKWS